jgi:hypothetical protein
MEKGLKNLNQAWRSAQKKQGTYEDGHMDSGIGHSDLDEETERLPSATLSDIPENAFSYPPSYPTTQQRMPSIQNMLQHTGPNSHSQY